ncbi:50S ribosomal protein L7/L12 [Plasmodium cynomolgi strain B]|uniref:50S ribosomal protein L7/L12 n=1 Tax=Plasmodium cynomolgi (strain B) TaxID=1120755 RepID=K6V787_PLACD|nr:50S ribosomal protein L7/L12 [Plasmodium cynomolgi strain B]GAB64977.1 50S ribosomal protein L7/L12 [Plasmodium cynomolgi strain B]
MKKNALVKNALYSVKLRQNGAQANAVMSAAALRGVDLWTNKTMQKRRSSGNATNSSFDLFDKIKDINGSNRNEEEGNEESDSKKRKPSKKVLKLVDEILNLTLIEAADLCDLCQEKLDGDKQFNNAALFNRNPFPHPCSFFGAASFSSPNIPPGMNSAFPSHVGAQGAVPPGAVPPGGTPNLGSAEKNEQAGTKKKEEKKNSKSTFNVKLENFDVKNKINTIKEIRKITNVGLKEAKDMVESAPFYVQKNVPAEKAEEMKKKFEELGATIILE